MAFCVEDSDYFSTWQSFISHLRVECSSLLVRHSQFSKLDGTLLMTPYRPVKNSSDVKELLQAISENSQLSPDERCPHA